MYLQKIKELKKKIDLKLFLKESDSSFFIDGFQCCISGRTGKPTIILGDHWKEFNTMDLLETYIKEDPFRKIFEKIEKPRSYKISNNLGNRLLLDGISGVETIDTLIKQLKDHLFQTQLKEINFRVKFEMWSNLKDRIGPGFRIEEGSRISRELSNTLRELSNNIPENEIWFGVVMVENAKEVLSTNKIESLSFDLLLRKDGFLKRGLLKNNDFAISFYAKSKAPFERLEYDFSLDEIETEPDNCIILKTMIDCSPISKDFALDVLKFDTYKKTLYSDPDFESVVTNPVFRYFYFKFLNNEKMGIDELGKKMIDFVSNLLNKMEGAVITDAALIQFQKNLEDISNKRGTVRKILDLAEFNKKLNIYF